MLGGLAWAAPVLADDIQPRVVPYGCYGYLPPGIYTQTHLPYFALHPPVYYSYPVPRPYGYSPYAYPPGTVTPEIIPRRPLVIQNKFVPKRAVDRAQTDRVTRTPLRIVNPYVVQSDRSERGRPNADGPRPARQPQVIFPTAVAENTGSDLQ